MHRYPRLTLVAVTLVVVMVAGCASSGVGSTSGRWPRGNESLSVTELMSWSVELKSYSHTRYDEALAKARRDFSLRNTNRARLRLAVTLMHDNVDNTRERYREAESLLREYLQTENFTFLNNDHRVFAEYLLTTNQAWMRISRQLGAARVETSDARKKIEELKSIEMRLNHPDNGYQ